MELTTKAQVTGHRFAVRLAEHGLVFGDLSMVHDPLGRRRRASVLGLVGGALVLAGAGVLAMFAPHPDPGNAQIVAVQGTLYASVDGTYHEVPNLTSARLVVGQPATPEEIAPDVFATRAKGVPVGIVGAPGTFTSAHGPWAVCGSDGGTQWHIVEGVPLRPLPEDTAFLAASGTEEYLVTAAGRQLLPAAHTDAGRVMRRRIGISETTPVWQVPPEVLSAVPLRSPVVIPPVEEVIVAGEEAWARSGGVIAPITPTQRDILLDVAIPSHELTRDGLAQYSLGTPLTDVPSHEFTFLTPAAVDNGPLCGSPDGPVGWLTASEPGSVPVAGSAVSGYSSATGSALAVHVGTGYALISATGTAFELGDAAAVEAIGVESPASLADEIYRLFPRGPVLSAATAARPLLPDEAMSAITP
ncbi:MAG: type VII secretion protein EccB [Corynebacterium sp.]|nr:type VII secretion protein EccB [Corynebacterium sp.]